MGAGDMLGMRWPGAGGPSPVGAGDMLGTRWPGGRWGRTGDALGMRWGHVGPVWGRAGPVSLARLHHMVETPQLPHLWRETGGRFQVIADSCGQVRERRKPALRVTFA